MGAVVEVEGHPVGPGPIVLKLLREEMLGDDRAAGRFRRELATHHRLTTGRRQVPRLVPCLAFDDGPDPAKIHGIFPFYPDGTLLQFMESGAALAAGLRVLADAVEGLQSMHGLRTVHRDICPQNIFVIRQGGVVRGVLGDLGMAVPLDGNTVFDESQVADDLRLRPGHLGYIDRVHSGTPEGDLFAVGATLYRMLAGRDPGPAADLPLGLPPPEECRPEVGRSLHLEAEAVIARLSHLDLGQRYADTAQAREAILTLAAAASAAEETVELRRNLHPGVILAVIGLLAAGLWVGWGWWGGPKRHEGVGPIPVTRNSQERPSPVVPQDFGADGSGRRNPDEVAPTPLVAAQGAVEASSPSPVSEPTPVPPMPAHLIAGANALIGDGEYARARALLEDAAVDYPGDPDVAGLLAALLARGGPGEIDWAEELLGQALESHPDRGDLRLTLARLEAQRGRLNRAVATLDAAPPDSSHRREIRSLAVTLDREGHRLE